MRVKTWKALSKFLRIYIFLLVFQVAFPKAAYAFLSSVDACAANPECAAVLGAELAPSVAAPTAAGSASTISITTATGASTTVEAASGVAVVGDMRLSGVAAFYIWNQAQNQQAQDLAQQKYCIINPNDTVCAPPFTGGQSEVMYDFDFTNTLVYAETGALYHGPYSRQSAMPGKIIGVVMILGLDGNYYILAESTSDPTKILVPSGKGTFYQQLDGFPPYLRAINYGISNLRRRDGLPDTGGNLPSLAWKDWPQEKRDAAAKHISPSDWQVSIPYMPQGGTLKPGDIIDALKSFIPGQKKDNPNTPEDERQSKIVPGPSSTWTGSLPFPLPNPPSTQAPLAPTIPADRRVYSTLNTVKNEGKAKLASGQGDQRGCFSAYLNNRNRSEREIAFVNYLTGRPDEFIVISKSGEVASFDGRQPGTRQVIELKDTNNETISYVTRFTQSKLDKWQTQLAIHRRVAKDCSYQLIGVTPNQYLPNFLNARLKNGPPFVYVKTPAHVKALPLP